jgi:hypothetical protein
MAKPSPVPPYFLVVESIGLGERLEDSALGLWRNTDSGVFDLEAQEGLFAVNLEADEHNNIPRLCKFDRVAN